MDILIVGANSSLICYLKRQTYIRRRQCGGPVTQAPVDRVFSVENPAFHGVYPQFVLYFNKSGVISTAFQYASGA